MKKILPSLHISTLILISFAILILFFSFKKYKNLPYQFFNQKKQLSKINSEIDTDGDGLFDWQEIIYNTNPEIKDTDGDGLSDKKEYDAQIAPNSNNIKKEQIKELTIAKTGGERKIENIIKQVIQNKGELNDEEINNIINNLGVGEKESIIHFEKELTLVNDTEKNYQIYQKRGEEIGQKYKKILQTNWTNFLIGFIKKSEDLEKKQELQNLKEFYQKIVIEVKNIKVPESLKDFHLINLNSLEEIIAALDDLAEIKNDSFIGLRALYRYWDAIDLISKTNKKILLQISKK